MKIASSEERLNELFSADPRSDSAIAAELDVSKQALSAWRKGIRSPKKTVLLKIAQIYNVSIDWLMGFDVPKIEESVQSGYQPETIEAKILANGIDKLPQEQRERALAMFRVMFEPQYADMFTKENEK